MMSPSEHPDDRKVTLEELLRVKRAERPSPEFWTHFERDLRAKQLAAIIEPRPWWIALRLPQLGRALARYQLPAGAAAALALGLVAVREYYPFDTAVVADAGATVSVAAAVIRAQADAPVAEPRLTPVETTAVAAAAPTREVAPASAPLAIAALHSLPAGPGELLAMIPWAAPRTAPVVAEPEPAVLGELPKVHFASAIKPARDHRFEDRVEEVSVTVASTLPVVETPGDPAAPARVSPVSPREVRRSRLLAEMVVADAADADRSRMTQVREVLASTLGDDQLYDSVRRLGMGGDRLTLKF